MSVFELVRRSAISYVSVKVALSILGLVAFVPLTGLLYWSFDSAYLAALGIGPEIFSRPVFSSKLMLTWFILEAVFPSIWIIGVVAFSLFGVLVWVQIRRSNRPVATSNCGSPGKLVQILDVIERAFTPTITLFFAPIFAVFIILWCMVFMSNKAEKLALNQIDTYVKFNACPDTFNNKNKGCYFVSGESGINHFVIVNSETLIIYLSRKESIDETIIFTNIRYKSSGDKIVRELRRVKNTTEKLEDYWKVLLTPHGGVTFPVGEEAYTPMIR